MSTIYWQVLAQLGAAILAGGVIGAERSYHGRAAGLRTHALVCLAAAAAVTACAAPGLLPGDATRLDAARLGQGVMTGVGFLGAGVIFKEGVNIQGLTTAASVWATSAVGILFGVGAFGTGFAATVGVVGVLVILRWVENLLPAHIYAWSVFRFRSAEAPDVSELRSLLARFRVTVFEVSYGRSHDGAFTEFSGNLTAVHQNAFDDLARHLRVMEGLAEFELARISK